LPWIFKIFYGLISDNVPIRETKRKSWLVIMGFIQFLALFLAFYLLPKNPLIFALLICTASLAIAFINVVGLAMMTI
jgi:hypothetical protein